MAATQRYLMFVSYVGTGFWGSQLQRYQGCMSTRETVQYVLESGLKHVFGLTDERPIHVRLASRTDRGVHALRAAVQVDLPEYKGQFLRPSSLAGALNKYFRNFKSVRVLEVHTVPDSFSVHAAIIDKTYMLRWGQIKEEFYENGKSECRKPVLEVDRTCLSWMEGKFDLRKAEEAASLFEGTKDFGAIVSKPTKNTKPTVCNIISFTVEPALPLVPFDPVAQKYNYYNFTCRGDRFLYHMVRRMISLTISVGFDMLTLKDIQKLFDEPTPSSWPRRCAQMVSGSGLYLVNTNVDLTSSNQIKDEAIDNKTEEIPLVAES